MIALPDDPEEYGHILAVLEGNCARNPYDDPHDRELFEKGHREEMEVLGDS